MAATRQKTTNPCDSDSSLVVVFIFASSSQLTWQLGVTEEGISLTEVSSNRESRDEGFTWFEMHNVKNVEA